jgi:hypothetical protein
VGSGIENHGKYGELIYAYSGDDLFVNLFIPSTLNWEEQGVSITQTTRFPYEESTRFQIQSETLKIFDLNIRKPEWIEGDMEVTVNGEPVDFSTNSFSYISIDRAWGSGDIVEVSLPMKTSVEYLPDGSPWASFLKGPIVLAAVTGTENLGGLFADEARMAHVADDDFYPIDEAPALVTNDPTNLADQLEQTGPMSFTINTKIYGDYESSELELVPFFTIHEARYMMYWPVYTEQEIEERTRLMKEQEAAMIALDNRTVDMVSTGEQQPESEHNFKAKDSESGIHQGRFWRHASGWFSYDFSNPNEQGSILRVTYSGSDQGRIFDILVNGEVLKTVTSTGRDETFFDVDYTIPKSMIAEEMTIRFEANENSVAGGVYEIRLLTAE